MKQILLFLLILNSIFSFSQTYTIPGATEQPAWVFPLWFEDGAGNKDTLYFGYDPDAQDFGWPQSDSVFGEELISIDTAIFNSLWVSGFMLPEALKVVVWKNLVNSAVISFYKTFYPPLILRWDKNLFYSDVLPFPENGSAPNAWGEIVTEGNMTPSGCSFEYPFIMTDTSEETGLACYHADSMVFENGELSGLQFTVNAWRPNWSSMNDLNLKHKAVTILQNPTSGTSIVFNSGMEGNYEVKLLTLSGDLIEQKTFIGSGYKNFPIQENLNGLYVFQVIKNNFFQSFKIIIL